MLSYLWCAKWCNFTISIIIKLTVMVTCDNTTHAQWHHNIICWVKTGPPLLLYRRWFYGNIDSKKITEEIASIGAPGYRGTFGQFQASPEPLCSSRGPWFVSYGPAQIRGLVRNIFNFDSYWKTLLTTVTVTTLLKLLLAVNLELST